MLSRRSFIRSILVGLGAICAGDWEKLVKAAEGRAYYRVVVLGDPHLPVRILHHPHKADQEKILAAKNAVIDDINSWPDVDAVAVVGDLVEQRAVPKEYAYIRKFFGRLKHKLWVINGNHEFLYRDQPRPDGKPVVADPAVWNASWNISVPLAAAEAVVYEGGRAISSYFSVCRRSFTDRDGR